jgi:hypothetical protein
MMVRIYIVGSWVMTSCSLVDGYLVFRMNLQPPSSESGDGGRKPYRDVNSNLREFLIKLVNYAPRHEDVWGR